MTNVCVKIMVNVYLDRKHIACKCYSIYLEDSDGRPASNRRPILKLCPISTSQYIWLTDKLFCRRNGDQVHWIYAWNFELLRLFTIICNADDVQTSIMWQGTSTYRSSLWKGRRYDSNKSAIDLRILRGRRFE